MTSTTTPTFADCKRFAARIRAGEFSTLDLAPLVAAIDQAMATLQGRDPNQPIGRRHMRAEPVADHLIAPAPVVEADPVTFAGRDHELEALAAKFSRGSDAPLGSFDVIAQARDEWRQLRASNFGRGFTATLEGYVEQALRRARDAEQSATLRGGAL